MPLQKVALSSLRIFKIKKSFSWANRCFPKQIMKCWVFAPQWRQKISVSICYLSIDYVFLFPCNHTIFITLTALRFWDFKAEYVVDLLKQSVWKHVQL